MCIRHNLPVSTGSRGYHPALRLLLLQCCHPHLPPEHKNGTLQLYSRLLPDQKPVLVLVQIPISVWTAPSPDLLPS